VIIVKAAWWLLGKILCNNYISSVPQTMDSVQHNYDVMNQPLSHTSRESFYVDMFHNEERTKWIITVFTFNERCIYKNVGIN